MDFIKPKFCREISTSIGDLLIQDLEATSTEADSATIINADFSNVEFYLECTNDNVGFLNFNRITSTDYLFGEVKTSYGVYQLSSEAKTKLSDSSLSLDVYSNVFSKEFDLSAVNYPYTFLDYSDYISQVNSVIKTPNEYLPGSQFVKDYDYAFTTQLFITEIKKNRFNYEVNWSTQFEVSLNGSSGPISVVTKKAVPAEPDGSSVANYGAYSGDLGNYPLKAINNKESPFNSYLYPTNIYSVTDLLYRKFKERSHSRNNFHYTNDLPITKYWDEYRLGRSGGKSSGSSQSVGNTITNEIEYTSSTVTTIETVPGEYVFVGPVIPAQVEKNKTEIRNYLKYGVTDSSIDAHSISWLKLLDYETLWWIQNKEKINSISTIEAAYLKWEIGLTNLITLVPTKVTMKPTSPSTTLPGGPPQAYEKVLEPKEKWDLLHTLWTTNSTSLTHRFWGVNNSYFGDVTLDVKRFKGSVTGSSIWSDSTTRNIIIHRTF